MIQMARDFQMDIKFFLARLRLPDDRGEFTKKMFDELLPNDMDLLAFKWANPIIDVCRYYYDPSRENGNVREWQIRNQKFLVELRLLYIYKQAIWEEDDCFEIHRLDLHKLSVLYFSTGTSKLPPKYFFTYQPILIRRLENIMTELQINTIVFKELCQEAFDEIPESDDISFELSLINSDKKTAKSKLISLIRRIRNNYSLQLKKDSLLATELKEIEKAIDNEIIDLNFWNFRYCYSPSEWKLEHTIWGQDIELALKEIGSSSKLKGKSPEEVRKNKSDRISYNKKLSNYTIATLYAVLKYAQDNGLYHGGDVLSFEMRRKSFTHEYNRCHYFKQDPGFEGLENTINDRFEICQKTLKKLGADFNIDCDHNVEILKVNLKISRHDM